MRDRPANHAVLMRLLPRMTSAHPEDRQVGACKVYERESVCVCNKGASQARFFFVRAMGNLVVKEES